MVYTFLLLPSSKQSTRATSGYLLNKIAFIRHGVSWSQDNALDIAEVFGAEGEATTVGSNEFTLGIGYLF